MIPYKSFANEVRLLAERSDSKDNVKLGGFRSQLQASNLSSHTEELWYNETDCLWMTIYIVILICFILSGLFRADRQARFPKLGSKPGWLNQETSASEGNLNGYVSQLFLFYMEK